MAIRIVVPAFRSAETLPACVDAIAQSERVRDGCCQLCVVDDGDNGDLAQLLAGQPVTIVDSGRSGSAAVARNMGAQGARNGILVFIDADVLVEPDAIRRLVDPIRAGDAEATVGNYSSDTRGMGFVQSYKQLYLARVYSRSAGFIRNHFWSAVCAINAEAFSRLGGFAARFKGACDEDTELGQRITRAGGRILAVPDARARNLKAYGLRSLLCNDLHKGISTVQLFLGKDVRLTDNRHSSRRDILAVLSAGLLLLLPGLAWLLTRVLGSPLPATLAVAGLPLLYLSARGDLLAYFRRARGVGFAACTVPLMLLLDLVRGFCLLLGALLFSWRQVGTRSPHSSEANVFLSHEGRHRP